MSSDTVLMILNVTIQKPNESTFSVRLGQDSEVSVIYWLKMTENSGQGAASLLPFEKLDGRSNYSSWKFQMELYLIHDGPWDYTTENATVRITELDNPVTIENATYVPVLPANLLSVSTLVRKGLVVVFSEKGCEIFKREECRIQVKPRVSAREERGMYKLSQDQMRCRTFRISKIKVQYTGREVTNRGSRLRDIPHIHDTIQTKYRSS